MLVPVTLSDRERWDVKGQSFWQISVIILVWFDLELPNFAW